MQRPDTRIRGDAAAIPLRGSITSTHPINAGTGPAKKGICPIQFYILRLALPIPVWGDRGTADPGMGGCNEFNESATDLQTVLSMSRRRAGCFGHRIRDYARTHRAGLDGDDRRDRREVPRSVHNDRQRRRGYHINRPKQGLIPVQPVPLEHF